MKYQDILNILSEGNSFEWLYFDSLGVFTYKNDVNLRIVRSRDERNTSFNEAWAVDHPDRNATRVFFTVYYGQSPVYEKMFVDVDGYRATLPLPDLTTMQVPFLEYQFASIINGSNGNRLDEYLRRSGLTVKEE
ncbi:hypothetical protein KTH77_14795 [Acinetobacter baumannii]|uniref:hypothetical protein n=1 Tax=Acinetobacter baumannii TaxID=470 RepID=UPI0019008673|nr:hypothetical protein [Acinetobacter baumannii]MBJ9493353.1 hypothetical protein [Acinetobacter baumannii]MCT9183650.1 hypothetical protein [Acinetobacter baumannii]MCT9224288.1 hypothetical protein [Acinetobacter baumannii]MCT9276131.1 hypothetical protein [Acinetobacter baumannii]